MAQTAIFIGYRREDTADVVGRVYDRLSAKFGEPAVFKDVDNLPVGTNFGDYILTLLPQCRVFLAMIGPDWVDARKADGSRRIDDEDDWVRIEIEAALSTPGVHVVPVLANGAAMPRRDELPESLHGLRALNAAHVRRDPDFHKDMDRLIEAIEKSVRDATPAPTPPPPLPAPTHTPISPRVLWGGGAAIVAIALAITFMQPHPPGPTGIDLGAKSVMGNATTWPPSDIPGVAKRAADYIHRKWKSDAVLMSIEMEESSTGGGVDSRLTFYSPSEEQEITLFPAYGTLSAPYARDTSANVAIPQNFLDLPAAIEAAHNAGMRGKNIKSAVLEWTSGPSCGTGNFAIDNAILPKCPPGPRYEGPQWAITSAFNDRRFVPATN